MGGPVLGVSSGLNVAYYDALLSMAAMSENELSRSWYLSRASTLKRARPSNSGTTSSVSSKWARRCPQTGSARMSTPTRSQRPLCPPHPRLLECLSPSSGDLPAAFQDLGHWGGSGVASPYASGFAVEALFARGEARPAVDLLRTVWHPMSASTGPDLLRRALGSDEARRLAAGARRLAGARVGHVARPSPAQVRRRFVPADSRMEGHWCRACVGRPELCRMLRRHACGRGAHTLGAAGRQVKRDALCDHPGALQSRRQAAKWLGFARVAGNSRRRPGGDTFFPQTIMTGHRFCVRCRAIAVRMSI